MRLPLSVSPTCQRTLASQTCRSCFGRSDPSRVSTWPRTRSPDRARSVSMVVVPVVLGCVREAWWWWWLSNRAAFQPCASCVCGANWGSHFCKSRQINLHAHTHTHTHTRTEWKKLISFLNGNDFKVSTQKCSAHFRLACGSRSSICIHNEYVICLCSFISVILVILFAIKRSLLNGDAQISVLM